MRVVIAEDSTLMRDGLSALLERAGHTVVDAATTAPELERVIAGLHDDLPDLVIADVRMPPTCTDDGLRAAVSLRQQHAGLPVLLLSQHMGPQYLERLLHAVRSDPDAAGVGYLLKDRVAHVRDFMNAMQTVVDGGMVIDQKLMAALHTLHTDKPSVLTPREEQVLQHLAAGATNIQIAESLHLSQGAVVKNLSAVFDKLELPQDGNRRVLAALAYLRHKMY